MVRPGCSLVTYPDGDERYNGYSVNIWEEIKAEGEEVETS